MTGLDPLRRAKYYATIKHGDQMYGGNLPYTHHLAAVEEVVTRFNDPPEDYGCEETLTLQEAAWLHDVVEDTGTKLKEVSELFGENVAKLVGAVTNEPSANRKIRAALTYPKIREAGPDAVRLKLADRIANMEMGGKLLDMYKKEYVDFRRSLYTPNQNEDMWQYLDGLLK